MKIGFLNNQIDNRGTGNAVFNYAKYNQELLGNESVILTFPSGAHSENAVNKYVAEFGAIYTATEDNLKTLDILYHIKSGEDDEFRPPTNVKYVPHAVFHPQKHGDDYFVISKWMSQKYHLPYVPHIVQTDETDKGREIFGIPKDATVFGRYGGPDTFDIPFVWEAMEWILEKRPDVWFIFSGTNPHIQHGRIRYFPNMLAPQWTRMIINASDAMIHARHRGETFGISVGEFAQQKKPIITYKLSGEKAHLHELKGSALTYIDAETLKGQFDAFYRTQKFHAFYDEYTPERVMHHFKQSVINGYYYYENPGDYTFTATRQRHVLRGYTPRG